VRVGGRALWIGLLLLGILAAFIFRGASAADSPQHRTDSDAANGASALPQLAQRFGHPTATLDATFDPGSRLGALFVLTPAGFTAGEASRLLAFLTAGGLVVYGSEQGDPELDRTLGVKRRPPFSTGEASSTSDALTYVGHVSGAETVLPLTPGAGQVVLLRGMTGGALAFEQHVGAGVLVVLADPLPLCNGYLEKADNGQLAADLLALAPAGTRIGFDEYHHGGTGGGSPLSGVLSTSWGVAIVWTVLALFAGLFLRGRAFGPYLELPGAPSRSTSAHVAAVAGLLERSGAAAEVGQLLMAHTRRALARRHGLTAGAGFERALQARAPAEAGALATAEAELAGQVGETALLGAARRLHPLDYPVEPVR
jgi:hypothetical protein